MRKPILIIVALIIVLLLIFLWVYLLFFRTANPEPVGETGFPEIPTTFPDSGGIATTTPENVTDTATPLVDVTDGKRLRQLTTRPVAGFVELFTTSSTTPVIRYAEAGTGIVFDIDMSTGLERTVTDYVQTQNHLVVFSPSGNQSLLQTSFGRSTITTLGRGISATSTAKYQNLPRGMEEPRFINENSILFLERTNNTTTAKKYQVDTGATLTLFSIPFREVTVAWGSTEAGPHFAYPKPSARLEGFGLEITNGKTTRLPIDGFGFTMIPGGNYILYSERDGESYRGYIYDRTTETTNPLPVISLPEKCAYSGISETFTCGHEFISFDERYPDEWYKGNTRFSDAIWNIQPGGNSAFSVVDLQTESGRQIDVTNLVLGLNESFYYFFNKIDRTLWLYQVDEPDA